MAGRNNQVARIFAVLDILEGASEPLLVSEIHTRTEARGFSESKRTIYRDLEALALAGFPLFPDSDSETNQKWSLERTAKITQYLVLTARELFALFVARGALKPLESTPFYEDIQKVFIKLEQKLGIKQSEYLETLDDEIRFEPGPSWGLGINPDTLETVRTACSKGFVIEALYYSVNSKTERKRRLGPHYLYYAKGGLYLVAEDLDDKKVKVFALPRIKSIEMKDEVYHGKVITPEEFFNGGMSVFTGSKPEEIVLEFSDEVAQFVKERRWHSSQRTVNLEGGRIRVTLELGQTPELISWVLSFGPGAKVVSPASLAERVLAKAMETAKMYSKKTG
jgi:proteasome accessory factor B